ncbi:hypothetical protein BpHYR1_050688 [Brachionus plicatilis]|uniref:Uncharacterized protein n=1 Tax=Brachionus plicatilis TaxID=10195 RepID=A0A3M7RBG1_BRAPC|nr:hypothetical protein BpHYR1_050688 [Brachionus plicatilis]
MNKVKYLRKSWDLASMMSPLSFSSGWSGRPANRAAVASMLAWSRSRFSDAVISFDCTLNWCELPMIQSLNYLHTRVQVAHISHHIYHQTFHTNRTQRTFTTTTTTTLILALQHTLHYKNNIFHKQSILVIDDHLARRVKKLVHNQLYLFEQNGIALGAELVAKQVLYMALHLVAKLFALTNEQLEQIANELGDRAIVEIGGAADRLDRCVVGGRSVVRRQVVSGPRRAHRTDRCDRGGRHGRAVLAAHHQIVVVLGRLFVGQPHAAQGAQKAGHVGPFGQDVVQLVLLGERRRQVAVGHVRVEAVRSAVQALARVDYGRADEARGARRVKVTSQIGGRGGGGGRTAAPLVYAAVVQHAAVGRDWAQLACRK